MKRIFVYPKDVMKLNGKGRRAAQKLLKDMRMLYKKEKHQPVTPKELADYLNIDPDSIDL